MKKTITILWIIIIAGTIFIAIHLMELQNIEESTSETDETIENTTNLETDSTVEEGTENKTTEVIIEQTPAIISENTDKTFTTILLANMTIIEDIILFKAICLSTEFFMLAACSPNNLCRISILLDFLVEAMK